MNLHFGDTFERASQAPNAENDCLGDEESRNLSLLLSFSFFLPFLLCAFNEILFCVAILFRGYKNFY